MPSSSRSGFVVAVAAALALAGCSSAGTAPRSCQSTEECPSGARCLSAACVANAPPVPAIALPAGALETNVLLAFDGAGSADPDAGDAVESFGWSFRALGADCDPPVVAGSGPVATVRFACPGRYAVDLTVTDRMPASATAVREFDVIAYSGPALVTVGADVALEHRCTTLPTRCAPEGEIVLSAAAPGFAPDDVTFEWTVEPPADRPLDPNRRVTFTPGPLVAAPAVSIETDGQAISGDWIFSVRARDAAGVVGTAATRVSVRNRPPVVQKTIPAVDHLFAAGQFQASGAIPFSVTDPDGDALVGPFLELRHVGDGGGTFSAALAAGPDRVAFEIAVPYEAPADALHLIGGPGLERTITFRVGDANGGETAETWPILVGNRAPVLASTPAPFTVDHIFDPVALAYRARVPLSAWMDPDGDPLFQATGVATGDPLCPAVTIPPGSGPRVATADCALSFTGVPAVANFAGAHSVRHVVQDPWVAAQDESTVAFTIANWPPVLASAATLTFSGACFETGCCRFIAGEGCLELQSTSTGGTITVPSSWSDPDGDPLEVRATPASVAPSGTVCVDAACPLSVTLGELPQVCGRKTETIPLTAGDGAATVTGSFSVERTCPSL